MINQVQTVRFKQYTSSYLNTAKFNKGEIFFDATNNTLRVMDGSTAGGTQLALKTYVDSAVSNLTGLINSDKIINDPTPTLSVNLNANLQSIGRLADPSQDVVTAFNSLYPVTPTTLNQLPVTVGYANSKYAGITNSSTLSSSITASSLTSTGTLTTLTVTGNINVTTGNIVSSAKPTASTHLTNKLYVDARAIASAVALS